MEERTKQVTSILELVWMFKLNFKNKISHCLVPVWTECLNPEFQFRVLHFGALYLSNQSKPAHDPLSKVAEKTNFFQRPNPKSPSKFVKQRLED